MALGLALQWVIILISCVAWAAFSRWTIKRLEQREQEELTAPAFFDSEEAATR